MSNGGGRSPEALDRAASELESVAAQVAQIAQATQAYRGKIDPIVAGVEQLVGGSASGKDRQIASMLKSVAQGINRSASASHECSQQAKRLAAQARTEADQIRRQQEADRQRNEQQRARR